MTSLSAFLTYIVACIAIVIVPGPTVTMIVANSLKHGTRAGMINVVGTQAGLALMLGVLAAGLGTVMAMMERWFWLLQIAGAAYLVWLGIGLLRSDGALADGSGRARPGGSFFWQGFFVILSNPKVLLLFGALIPQFLDPAASAVHGTLMLGLAFMVVSTLFDGLYAALAGSAGGWLSQKNIRVVEIAAGLFLIAGGIWLALVRR